MTPSPLFMFGLPRSGTNLVTRVLNMHPEVMVAIHGFQPLFKSLRNAAIREFDGGRLRDVDLEQPVHDGHFDPTQRQLLDVVHAATLDLPFIAAEWPELHRRLVSRAKDDAADLCEGMASLAGNESYLGLANAALNLIAETRDATARKWVGMIDTWVIDLLPALARAYPTARFIVIERDPRGIVNSILGYLSIDPEQAGHILSVVRHWRKAGALLQHFAAMPEIGNRLFQVRYEDMVAEPARTTQLLCDFLDIEFRPDMIDLDSAIDLPTGRKWEGNSTFDASLDNISTAPAERWRSKLPRDAIALVEFAAGIDMLARGYEPINELDLQRGNPEALAFLVKDGERPCSWRCDSGDPLREYGLESARRNFLEFELAELDEDTIRRSFLYPDYFKSLKQALPSVAE
jgi:hypothetical protein